MKDINPLLQQFADKLGTTVTYLWQVLVHQAFINGITNLIYYVITTILGVTLYKIHKKVKEDYDEIGIAIPMVFGLFVFVGLLICCIGSISDTINSFFNPEYWALDQILNNIKNK